MHKIKLYIILLVQYAFSFFGAQKSEFLSDEETVRWLLENKKSFIRYGDGEFDIIEGKSIHYQIYDRELAFLLNEIIMEYINTSQECSYLIGMPRDYINRSGCFMLRSRLLMSCWSHARYIFIKKYDKQVKYGNAHLFAKGNNNIYDKLWNSIKLDNVIFVHNNKKYSEEFEDKYQIKSNWVGIPKQNAFEKIEEIYESIVEKIIDKTETMVVISAGPCGKVLAYKLAKNGYWAIDTGHCWDEPLILNE